MAMLRRGSQGDIVRNVQGMLYQAGLYDGMVDGIYGAKTEDAVKKWQTFIGAKSDGLFGPLTLGASVDTLQRFNSVQSVDTGMPVVPYLKGQM